ncbi:hypothetical protein NPIL_121831 [Nephila pilipes]|uniref:Uncharacterized protein n=1 Tax=Nephila pilipes TaxID=299642 RepID=A0A8X6T4M0_NEPPI|nr:hypothetical protein NPIL_121831 [Nephila pilipes]
MEMLNDSQNEMEFKDDSRSSISSISTSSIDTSSTCERKQRLNQRSKSIQVYVKLPNENLPKTSPFTMTMNTRNIKASRIQSGYSMKN